MKIIFAISRFFFIFFIWTIGYFFWLQRLMLNMWGFNPLAKMHWNYIWREWQRGWVIQSTREWLFIIAIFAMIPVWLTGCAILSTVPWMKWFKLILIFPVRLIRSRMKKKLEKNAARPKVTKKKSYKKTRPPAIRAASGKIKSIEKAPEKENNVQTSAPAPAPASRAAEQPARTQTSSPALTAPATGSAPISGNSVIDILRSAGYRVISDAKIAGKKLDFVAIAANHILLCLIDSESGDWLADEERFNDEEPLWFSESNHRISPVRIVLNARDALTPLLTGSARGMEIKTMVVIRQGTIINAEDMFEVWNGLNVTVCRFEEGGPEDIASLQTSVSSVTAPDDGLYHSVSGVLK